jgi:enoyl-CoA hydratase/carnithine racemase
MERGRHGLTTLTDRRRGESGMRETVSLVSTARVGAVLQVTLDRPEKRNALNRQLALDACDAVEAVADDDAIAVIVLRGAGGSLSAGADLSDADAVAAMRRDYTRDPLARLPRLLRASAVPTVAVVDGYALGAGTALAGSCTFTVATRRSIFGLPEGPMGYFPYGVVPFLSDRVAAHTVLEWGLSGRKVSAEEATRAGLVTHFVEDPDLISAVDTLTTALSMSGPKVAREGIRWLSTQRSGIPPGDMIAWGEAEIQRAADT